MSDVFLDIKNRLGSGRRVLIACHEDPDGDTIGSALALSLALDCLGIANQLFCVHDVPRIYRFLPKAERFVKVLDDNNFDTLIAVDCGDLSRVRLPEGSLKGVKNIINIDHHPDNTRFGGINFVESRSATAELVFEVIQSLGIKIDERIAAVLYVAILTDTGNFTYDNTTAHIFSVAQELVKAGAQPQKIASAVYENKSPSAVRLLRDVLKTIQFGKEGRVAWVLISNKMMKRNKAKSEDLTGIVDLLRSIEGVEVAAVIRESGPERKIKVNLRSKLLNIQKVAKNLGGGGHFKASGAALEGRIKAVSRRVLAEIYKLF